MARSWKASELAIARLLGGERVPVNGRVRGSVPDVAHRWLAIEVKSWGRMPARVVDAMDQALKSAAWEYKHFGLTKLPIAVIHHDRQHHGNDLVVLRLTDFLDWFGSSPQPPQPAVPASNPAQEAADAAVPGQLR